MTESKPKIIVLTSATQSIPEIRSAFDGFDLEFGGAIRRKGFGDIAVQIMIFLSTAFVGGAAWDLFKFSIQKLLNKFPKAQIVVSDADSIIYTIKDEQNIVVIVIPDRAKEFEHVKTLDDLIKHLKEKYE